MFFARLGQSLVLIFLLFLGLSFGFPGQAQAQSVEDQYQDILDQGIIFAGICTSSSADCDCRDEGKCTLNDILQILVNISVLILGISGSLVLLLFVYGGILWMTAAGNANRIEEGKKTMVGAILGLLIIFGSYAIITFLVSVLKDGEAPESGETIEDILGEDADNIIETSNE